MQRLIQQSFAWDEYYKAAFKGKFIGLLICVLIILSVVYKISKIIIKQHKESQPRSMMTSEDAFALIGHLTSCAIIVLFIFTVIWPTFRYSMYLPFETEDCAIVGYGFVTDIAPVPNSPKFNVETDKKPHYASFVTISGAQYYFLTAEGLLPGMRIEFEYLPHSRMVLNYKAQSRSEDGLREPDCRTGDGSLYWLKMFDLSE